MRRASVLFLLAALLLSGCSRQDRSSPLFANLYSRESPEQVRSRLRVKDWEVVEDRRPLPTDERPPFHHLRVMVRGYSHHGVEGDLLLHFFNDRLMKTQFYPQDLGAYRRALQREDEIVFGSDLGLRLNDTTWVWVGKDEAGSYVGWRDLNLQREMDEWIKQYS